MKNYPLRTKLTNSLSLISLLWAFPHLDAFMYRNKDQQFHLFSINCLVQSLDLLDLLKEIRQIRLKILLEPFPNSEKLMVVVILYLGFRAPYVTG